MTNLKTRNLILEAVVMLIGLLIAVLLHEKVFEKPKKSNQLVPLPTDKSPEIRELIKELKKIKQENQLANTNNTNNLEIRGGAKGATLLTYIMAEVFQTMNEPGAKTLLKRLITGLSTGSILYPLVKPPVEVAVNTFRLNNVILMGVSTLVRKEMDKRGIEFKDLLWDPELENFNKLFFPLNSNNNLICWQNKLTQSQYAQVLVGVAVLTPESVPIITAAICYIIIIGLCYLPFFYSTIAPAVVVGILKYLDVEVKTPPALLYAIQEAMTRYKEPLPLNREIWVHPDKIKEMEDKYKKSIEKAKNNYKEEKVDSPPSGSKQQSKPVLSHLGLYGGHIVRQQKIRLTIDPVFILIYLEKLKQRIEKVDGSTGGRDVRSHRGKRFKQVWNRVLTAIPIPSSSVVGSVALAVMLLMDPREREFSMERRFTANIERRLATQDVYNAEVTNVSPTDENQSGSRDHQLGVGDQLIIVSPAKSEQITSRLGKSPTQPTTQDRDQSVGFGRLKNRKAAKMVRFSDLTPLKDSEFGENLPEQRQSTAQPIKIRTK